MLAAAIFLLAATAQARAQDYVDPQAVLNGLIRQHQQQDVLRQENERLRLQIERLDLERQLQYRRLTDSQIMAELSRYCPAGARFCHQTPPQILLQEAATRGLIQLSSQEGASGQDCMIIGLGEGDGIIDCQ